VCWRSSAKDAGVRSTTSPGHSDHEPCDLLGQGTTGWMARIGGGRGRNLDGTSNTWRRPNGMEVFGQEMATAYSWITRGCKDPTPTIRISGTLWSTVGIHLVHRTQTCGAAPRLKRMEHALPGWLDESASGNPTETALARLFSSALHQRRLAHSLAPSFPGWSRQSLSRESSARVVGAGMPSGRSWAQVQWRERMARSIALGCWGPTICWDAFLIS